MDILATSVPSHGTQAFLFAVAFFLLVTAGIVAWFVPPLVHRAVALAAWGLAAFVLVFLWIQAAA